MITQYKTTRGFSRVAFCYIAVGGKTVLLFSGKLQVASFGALRADCIDLLLGQIM